MFYQTYALCPSTCLIGLSQTHTTHRVKHHLGDEHTDIAHNLLSMARTGLFYISRWDLQYHFCPNFGHDWDGWIISCRGDAKLLRELFLSEVVATPRLNPWRSIAFRFWHSIFPSNSSKDQLVSSSPYDGSPTVMVHSWQKYLILFVTKNYGEIRTAEKNI